MRAFLALASDSAQRLAATGHAVPPRFEDAVVEGVLTAMPGPDDLRERLVLRYRVGVLLLGSEMLEEQRRAGEARRAAEAEAAALALERRRHEARERLVQQELWAEEERIRLRAVAEAEEQRREAAVKERLRQLRLEAARERLQETLSPLEEGARQLHAAVHEAATAIRDSLRKHQALRGASARRARELARWFRAMNWRSDEELEGLVAELERLATRAPARGQARPPAHRRRARGDHRAHLRRRPRPRRAQPHGRPRAVGGAPPGGHLRAAAAPARRGRPHPGAPRPRPVRRLARLTAATHPPEARMTPPTTPPPTRPWSP